MTKHIVLDSYPLGALSHPRPSMEILEWAAACRRVGHTFYVPEIIDYEIRRELLRAGKVTGITNLDALKTTFQYVPVTTAALLLAADLWAQIRRSGKPTAAAKALDIDVILAAQALTLGIPQSDFIIATTNVSHLSRFAPADLWTNILP